MMARFSHTSRPVNSDAQVVQEIIQALVQTIGVQVRIPRVKTEKQNKKQRARKVAVRREMGQPHTLGLWTRVLRPEIARVREFEAQSKRTKKRLQAAAQGIETDSKNCVPVLKKTGPQSCCDQEQRRKNRLEHTLKNIFNLLSQDHVDHVCGPVLKV